VRDKRRNQLLGDALEACRVEALRRLESIGLPPRIEVQLIKIVDQDNGWRSEQEVVTANALHEPSVLLAIQDETDPSLGLGLGDQLDPLADYLAETTDLESLPHPLLPGDSGSSAIRARFLGSMAHRYLLSLDDLERSDPQLMTTIQNEMDELCDETGRRYVCEVPIDGVSPESELSYRGVSLRPLTAYERGAALGARSVPTRIPGSEFVSPVRMMPFVPTALLSVATVQPRNVVLGWDDDGMLPHRVALAFYLKEYDLTSPETISRFHLPRWSSFGQRGGPFPLKEGHGANSRGITQTQFSEIVDLAFAMPPLSGEENDRKEIALLRALRGLGDSHVDSAFLDIAIALEAALLGSSQTELAYKFRLYGALFLRHDQSPEDTFEALKQIYEVRSKLVHGARVHREERMAASQMARDMAKAIVLKALECGWPDPRALDRVALTAP
jgi:hypothetical protein